MASLSIVIAAMSKIELVERTLVSVLANRPDGAEVVVVLNGEYADPYQLEGEVRFVRLRRGSSLQRCLNAGIATSDAGFVHTLACGAEVEEGWTTKAMRRFVDPKVAAVAPVVIDAAGRTRSAGLSYGPSGIVRSVNVDAAVDELRAPSFHGGFYRRSAIDLLGVPMAESLGEFADVDLGLRLRHVGYHVVCESQSRIVNDDTSEESRSEFHRGRTAERLFWRNAPMFGWFRSLGSYAGLMAGECGKGIMRPHRSASVLGRFVAMGEYPSYVRHWRHMSQLRDVVQRSLDEGCAIQADIGQLRSAA